MKRNILKIVLITLIIILIKDVFFMVYISYNNKKEVKSYYENNSSFNYKSDMVLSIPKINLEAVVKKADNDFKNLNKNLVYYKNDNYKKSIIILGHSGVGYGTFFNRIDELDKDDDVYLYKDKLKISYVVDKKYNVLDTNIDVLKINNTPGLTLITCDKKDKNKRLVVKLTLKGTETLVK